MFVAFLLSLIYLNICMSLCITLILQELKGTLQYHLGSLESLQSQFPPAAVTISPAQNTLFTRLLSVKYNVKMAIVTIDAYLDPGFATRFSTYHASDSPDSVTSSELERDVSNRFYYPLRPRPFYLGVGENREVNSQYYLDQLGFTFANVRPIPPTTPHPPLLNVTPKSSLPYASLQHLYQTYT